jgi:serpin B
MSTAKISIAALATAVALSAAPLHTETDRGPDRAPQNGAAASVINGLGGRLQVALAAAGDGDANLVFSPASIAIGLAMTSAGSAGGTLAEFEAVLGFADPAIHEEMGALAATLTTSDDGSFTLADSLWVQDGFALGGPFVTTLTDVYAAPPRQVDFEADPAAAADEINEWVGEATDQRVTELLGADDVTELTRLILADAVHLDADWESPFDPEATAPDEFTRGDGTTVSVDVMHQVIHARYGEFAGTQVIALPYTSGFELIVALPPTGGLADFEAGLAAAGSLDAALGGLTPTEVDLALPTWDFGQSLDLVDPLMAVGLRLAFDDDRADFSNITTEIPLVLSGVVHEADITVDEAGTEAAAASAVVVGEPLAVPPVSPAEPVVMDVDHPFFFAIRDFNSTAVVFQGRVVDPSH